jgi:hypothetical protein
VLTRPTVSHTIAVAVVAARSGNTDMSAS